MANKKEPKLISEVCESCKYHGEQSPANPDYSECEFTQVWPRDGMFIGKARGTLYTDDNFYCKAWKGKDK